ncbi:MAG: hypothetical protein J2P58_06120 [Acidimicrobiaceae bacterium]|nr:hypothetical protein [Acidimicrobiaceae bacterium]
MPGFNLDDLEHTSQKEIEEHLQWRRLLMVFFDPAESVAWSDFDAYSDTHVEDDVRVPGYLSARRYRLDLGHGSEFPSSFKYVTIYEVDRDMEALRKGTAAQAERGERRAHPAPEWYKDVTWAVRTCDVLSGGPDPNAPERLYLVFSATPEGMTFDEYSTWYGQHIKENLNASELLLNGWRYRVMPTPGSDDPPAHLALYELGGSPQEMLEQTRAGVRSGATSMIDTFHTMASLEAIAIGERRTGES